jgi:hypothetical protein
MTSAVLAIQIGKGKAAKRTRNVSRQFFMMHTGINTPEMIRALLALSKRHPFYKHMRNGDLEKAKKTVLG